MKTEHLITPPPELVQQWVTATESNDCIGALPTNFEQRICTAAARWGADQELEACCEHIRDYQWGFVDRPDGTKMHRAVDLQLVRRPKPPSLKELALEATGRFAANAHANAAEMMSDFGTIRRALEQLDD